MPTFDDARAPAGLRLYAIGDVHGCIDLLRDCHAWIEDDLARHPVADWRIVHVGDYIDRGPDSCGVIELLTRRREAEGERIVCLVGNHEAMFNDVLSGTNPDPRLWLANGGDATLASYGLAGDWFRAVLRAGRLREAALNVVPEAHLAFLSGLSMHESYGDYLFVHAGIEPGVALERQPFHSLIWIRDPFLLHEGDLGHVVVHGHTIRHEGVEVRPNRIDIDIGSFATGRLACIVLEGDEKSLLTRRGRKPLRLSAG